MLADDAARILLWVLFDFGVSEPVAESGDLFGPFVFGGKVGLRDGVMFAVENGVDGRAESGGHAVFAASQDGGPGCVEQDVADAGFAVQQDGDAALEGLDGGDAVALNGGHEEEVRLET